MCESDLALTQYISMGNIQTLKISTAFDHSDLWALSSWHLVLSMKKFRCLATSLQVHVTTLYINEYLPLHTILFMLPILISRMLACS